MNRVALFVLNEIPFSIPIEWIISEEFSQNNEVIQSSSGLEPTINKKDISLNVSIRFSNFGNEPQTQGFNILVNLLKAISQVSGQNFLNGVGKKMDFNTGVGDFLFKYSTTCAYFGIENAFPLAYLTNLNIASENGTNSSWRVISFVLVPYSFVEFKNEVDSNVIFDVGVPK